MEKILNGKVAVVTGGTRGIGYAIVKKYLEAGAKVVLFGSREETALNDPDINKYPEKERQLYNMASSQFYSCGNYVESLTMADKGIKLAYEHKDRKLMSQLLMTIGECHGEVGNMWHAINTFDRCIQILTEQLKKTPDWDTYFLFSLYSYHCR